MSKIIEKLTPEQEARLPEYRDLGLAISLGTHDPEKRPSDERLLEMFTDVYRAGGIERGPSKIIHVSSPLAGCIASMQVGNQVWNQVRNQVWNQVRNQVGEQVRNQVVEQVRNQVWNQIGEQVWEQVWEQVRNQVWNQVGEQVGEQVWEQVWDQIYKCGYGTHDASWLTFYRYFYEVVDANIEPALQPLIQLSQYVGWWWPFEDVVVVSEKPTQIHMQSGRLHRDLGPSVAYSDGLLEVYALNGVRFSGEEIKFVTTPASDLDPKEILSIRNVEQRAEVIKKCGIDKLFWDLKPTKLDSKNMYELYSVPVYEGMPRIYLKMQNPSVDEVHIEAVHPDCQTVESALNWRNFGTVEIPKSGFIAPIQLT